MDGIGAIGLARYISHGAQYSQPIYSSNPIKNKDEVTFYDELKSLLDSIPNKFYTNEAKQIANEKVKICREYFNTLKLEINSICLNKYTSK